MPMNPSHDHFASEDQLVGAMLHLYRIPGYYDLAPTGTVDPRYP